MNDFFFKFTKLYSTWASLMQLAVMSLISSTKDKEIVFAVVIRITKIPSEKYWVVFILIMYNIIRLNCIPYTTLSIIFQINFAFNILDLHLMEMEPDINIIWYVAIWFSLDNLDLSLCFPWFWIKGGNTTLLNDELEVLVRK